MTNSKLSSPEVASLEETVSHRPSSLWRDAFRHLFRKRSAIVGMVLLAALLFVALFHTLLATHDPEIPMLDIPEEVAAGVKKRMPPCVHLLGCPEEIPQHILGTDGNLRDFYSRMVYGAQWSLIIGFTTVGFAIVLGTLLGAVAGYAGGWVDNVIMRLMDVMLAFPSLILSIAIVTVLGPGLINALLAIGIVSIPVYSRIVRASVLSVKEADFVTADRALGVRSSRILFHRILPNALTPLIVAGTLGIATAILDAAALSFLGLGAQPPMPEWGSMLGAERNQVFTAPHLVFFPGIAIMLTVLSFNLLGDGMRDALDPRLNR
ncbi:MAG TPA: ABC transporter permease [Anaerolineae bacterium]|nr:ABC transporter permease [Anaerolineae bacterium]